MSKLIVSSFVILFCACFLSSSLVTTNAQSLNHVHGIDAKGLLASGTPGCSGTPCPVGLADYGIQYSYLSQSFQSWTNFTKLSIGLSDISEYDHKLSIQQNLVDYLIETETGEYQYWSQNVAEITQGGTTRNPFYLVSPADNVWNFSSETASMDSNESTGNEYGNCSTLQTEVVYICDTSMTVKVKLPFEIELVTETIQCSTGGGLNFYLGIFQDNKQVYSQSYDAICINSTMNLTGNFVVGGTNPAGLYDDAENILAGAGGGAWIKVSAIKYTMSFDDFNYSTGTYNSIPHAFSEGGNSAEGIESIKETASSEIGTGLKSTLDTQIQLW